MKKFKGSFLSYIIALFSLPIFLASCEPIDVFEKNVSIPGYAWASDFKPVFTFDITDTTSQYIVYIVLRHTDAYRFKNIWVNVDTQFPNGSGNSNNLDIKLATDEKGWLGSGMDDIFEHRIPITPPQHPQTLMAGTYRFRIANIMRENPLEHVMNVGIRLEKVR